MTAEQAEYYAELTESIESTTKIAGGINLVVCLLMSFALKYLWNMVNLFQFLIFVEQWKLSYPINAQLFLASLKNLVLMEFLPTQYVSNWLA